MNVLKFFNFGASRSGTSQPAAADSGVTASPLPVPGQVSNDSLKVTAPPPRTVEGLDDFQSEYSKLFPGGFWRRFRDGRLKFECPRPQITPAIVDLVLAEAGEVFTESDVAELKSLEVSDRAIDERFKNLSYIDVRSRIFARIESGTATARERLTAGEDLPVVHGEQEEIARVRAQQKMLHALLAENSEKTHAILSRATSKIEAAARRLAIKRKAALERHTASHGLADEAFVHDGLLLALAFIGLELATAVTRDHFPGMPLRACSDPKHIWRHWANATVLKTAPTVAEQEIAAAKEREAVRIQAAQAEQGLTEAEHKAKVDKINALNDEIRLQNPQTPEDIEEARRRGIIPASQHKRIAAEKIESEHRKLADNAASKEGK